MWRWEEGDSARSTVGAVASEFARVRAVARLRVDGGILPAVLTDPVVCEIVEALVRVLVGSADTIVGAGDDEGGVGR